MIVLHTTSRAWSHMSRSSGLGSTLILLELGEVDDENWVQE
jgi:hypothetical protein